MNGNEVPKIPEFQGTVSLGYVNQVGPGELTAKASVTYRGEYQYRLFNNSRYDVTPDYTQVNLFLQYAPDNTDLTFSLSVTNLFDTTGVNSRFSDPYGSAQTYETYITPRQAIFSVGYSF
ncbi:TonB-dependent receptor domain-containing protein [Sphingobium xanthum]|uniref:TonB-dependent receptor domain-containing protein n=1 Tax=Sphingobium xanthum TaxID=1387165 RepID=UPI0031B9F3D4